MTLWKAVGSTAETQDGAGPERETSGDLAGRPSSDGALESQTALPGALALTLPHTWLSLLLASPRALTLALTYWQRSSEAVIYGGDEILCMSNI